MRLTKMNPKKTKKRVNMKQKKRMKVSLSLQGKKRLLWTFLLSFARFSVRFFVFLIILMTTDYLNTLNFRAPFIFAPLRARDTHNFSISRRFEWQFLNFKKINA